MLPRLFVTDSVRPAYVNNFHTVPSDCMMFIIIIIMSFIMPQWQHKTFTYAQTNIPVQTSMQSKNHKITSESCVKKSSGKISGILRIFITSAPLYEHRPYFEHKALHKFFVCFYFSVLCFCCVSVWGSAEACSTAKRSSQSRICCRKTETAGQN